MSEFDKAFLAFVNSGHLGDDLDALEDKSQEAEWEFVGRAMWNTAMADAARRREAIDDAALFCRDFLRWAHEVEPYPTRKMLEGRAERVLAALKALDEH